MQTVHGWRSTGLQSRSRIHTFGLRIVCKRFANHSACSHIRVLTYQTGLVYTVLLGRDHSSSLLYFDAFYSWIACISHTNHTSPIVYSHLDGIIQFWGEKCSATSNWNVSETPSFISTTFFNLFSNQLIVTFWLWWYLKNPGKQFSNFKLEALSFTTITFSNLFSSQLMVTSRLGVSKSSRHPFQSYLLDLTPHGLRSSDLPRLGVVAPYLLGFVNSLAKSSLMVPKRWARIKN